MRPSTHARPASNAWLWWVFGGAFVIVAAVAVILGRHASSSSATIDAGGAGVGSVAPTPDAPGLPGPDAPGLVPDDDTDDTSLEAACTRGCRLALACDLAPANCTDACITKPAEHAWLMANTCEEQAMRWFGSCQPQGSTTCGVARVCAQQCSGGEVIEVLECRCECTAGMKPNEALPFTRLFQCIAAQCANDLTPACILRHCRAQSDACSVGAPAR